MQLTLFIMGFLLIMSGTGVADAGGSITSMLVRIFIGLIFIAMVIIPNYLKEKKEYEQKKEARLMNHKSNQTTDDLIIEEF